MIVLLHIFADQIMDRTPANLVANRWYDIGVQLQFKTEELDQIDRNHQPVRVEECCKAMLYSWKRITGIKTNKLM